jgi:predicted nucleotidyltransferase
MPVVCSIDPRAREDLLRRLRQLAARLVRELGVEEVHLFGSLARGTQHQGSDIDLLVIGELPGRVFDRIGLVLERTSLPVEPVVVSRAVLDRRLAEGHPFFTSILEHSIRLA